MRKSIPWNSIVNSEMLSEGPFGAEYKVPNLGLVWVGKSDEREVAAKMDGTNDELMCNLVTVDSDTSDRCVWAIVGFQNVFKA